jgi:hypothetical protein
MGLLTHKNPYTRLPLANDPVLAMTEIINEDSLLYLGMGASAHVGHGRLARG